ncbi:MAG: hypothetical protein ABI481_06215 [Pyrinomonadaceae bacterium]
MSSLLGLEEERGAADAATSYENEQQAAQVRGGANSFYWIAALSAINSLMYVFGSPVSFLAGLDLTQLADGFVNVAIENGEPAALKAVAIVFDFMLVAVFAFFGYYARKRSSAAFAVGIGAFEMASHSFPKVRITESGNRSEFRTTGRPRS